MTRQILNKSVKVDGIDIFYREAGDPRNPALLLLHGFPTSSIMFKNLMTALADRYYLVAPDFPGFGFSAFPDKSSFAYTFENIAACIDKLTDAIGMRRFSVFLHDYGCPIGLRICVRHPEKIATLIFQNGNTYDEGMGPEWDPYKDYWAHPTPEKKAKLTGFLSEEGVRTQYTSGLPEALLPAVSPELWMIDWDLMKRPGNIEMQWELNCDYASNVRMFPVFQEYFRAHQPPALVIWGRYDVFFAIEEVDCYQRDLPDVETHLVDGGHWALETNFDEVLSLMENFLSANTGR
ncbi:alpha/beta fold hydrolase [Chitinophaga lutea]|nr:alpha/beta hydrolase [Chitinophaga lutea]